MKIDNDDPDNGPWFMIDSSNEVYYVGMCGDGLAAYESAQDFVNNNLDIRAILSPTQVKRLNELYEIALQ